MVGAIGVSGGHYSQDMECARAALAPSERTRCKGNAWLLAFAAFLAVYVPLLMRGRNQ